MVENFVLLKEKLVIFKNIVISKMSLRDLLRVT